MADREKYFSLSDVYPISSENFELNTCADVDCGNFGVGFDQDLPVFRGRNAAERLAKEAENNFALDTGLGKYRLADSAFQEPVARKDSKSIICQHSRDNDQCGVQTEILSNSFADEEYQRMRSYNGVLNGAACKACGARYLADPDSFIFNGKNKIRGGKTKRHSVRVVHKPCRGKRGSRFTVSLDHVNQINTYDNIRILNELVSGTGINDLKRVIRDTKTGESIGMSRVYNRILWLEKTLLAYERVHIKQWQSEFSEKRHTKLSTDDLVISLNWESKNERKVTLLHCSVTADVHSGYVFRADLNFDPTVEPLSYFRDHYVSDNGRLKNFKTTYVQKSGERFTAPLLSHQRPSGKFDEEAFFSGCISEWQAFVKKLKRASYADKSGWEKSRQLIKEAETDIRRIRRLSKNYLNLDLNTVENKCPSAGIITRRVYTKLGHFKAVRDMLPDGEISLSSDQDVSMARVVPYVFGDLIANDQFEWLLVWFDKNAGKPEILKKTNSYQRAFRKFRQQLHVNENIDDIGTAYQRFLTERFTAAVEGGGKGSSGPKLLTNYRSKRYPSWWAQSPAQTAGEIDKSVGFPIVKSELRQVLRAYNHGQRIMKHHARREIAERIETATLQPISSFMNSLRNRISVVERAGGSSSRVPNSYINGAAYNPRILVALINIFRVYYNYFELRQYVSPANKHLETDYTNPGKTTMRIPGSSERIEIRKRRRLKPKKSSPAIRAGIQQIQAESETPTIPDLSKVLYQPWLYYGTPLWKKLQE